MSTTGEKPGKGVYVYNGILTNSNLSEKFNIPYKDIDLLLAVY